VEKVSRVVPFRKGVRAREAEVVFRKWRRFMEWDRMF